MNLNLITDPWIPVRLRDGTSKRIRPADIVDFGPGDDNPPVDFDAARPDFNGALAQFLIGLVQTFAAPQSESDWWEDFTSRPQPPALHEKLLAFEDAFNLMGTPAVFQTFGGLKDGKEKPLFDLLLDSPGGSTKTNNKDIFNKRRKTFAFCPRCAVLALLTMQINAPAGGPGFRTSIRGGGPVTTILRGNHLWHDVWFNIRPLDDLRDFDAPSKDNLGRILPWTTEMRVSDKDGVSTLPDNAHPAQIFWAMPRRQHLSRPIKQEEAARCACCNSETDQLFDTYRDKQYGVNYSGPWVHWLTPYDFDEKNDPNPLKTKQKGFAYKHWRGLVANAETKKKTRRPARVVEYFRKSERDRYIELDYPSLQVRVWAFGYDAEQAKIRSWHDGVFPLIAVPEEERNQFDDLARHLIEAADSTEYQVNRAIKRGLYGTVEVSKKGKKKWDYNDKASTDKSLFVQSSIQFWRDTESDFYDLLRRSTAHLGLGEGPEDARAGLKREWIKSLRTSSLSLFDRVTGYGNFHNSNPKSLALARDSLRWFFDGNKGGIHKPLQLAPRTKEESHG